MSGAGSVYAPVVTVAPDAVFAGILLTRFGVAVVLLIAWKLTHGIARVPGVPRAGTVHAPIFTGAEDAVFAGAGFVLAPVLIFVAGLALRVARGVGVEGADSARAPVVPVAPESVVARGPVVI